MPTRRDLLKSVAASLAAWLLPSRLFATPATPRFHFIHADTLNSWPVADPVAWALKNQHEPILERAAEGLRKLTENDGDRIIRLVVRRCRLNLLELCPDQVVVQFWAQHRANLRPFFKTHRLARPDVEVVLRDRKNEVVATQTGDDFLFGSQLAANFPLDLFQNKFASRFTTEPDDWLAARGTTSGFAWEGVECDRIPWAALKSAWRRARPMICPNCDTPTLLVNFGHPWTGMLSRTPRFIHVCGKCRRSFTDYMVNDVAGWMAANLDPEVQPGFEMAWDRRVRRAGSTDRLEGDENRTRDLRRPER